MAASHETQQHIQCNAFNELKTVTENLLPKDMNHIPGHSRPVSRFKSKEKCFFGSLRFSCCSTLTGHQEKSAHCHIARPVSSQYNISAIIKTHYESVNCTRDLVIKSK